MKKLKNKKNVDEEKVKLLLDYEKFCAECHGFKIGNDVLIMINAFLNKINK